MPLCALLRRAVLLLLPLVLGPPVGLGLVLVLVLVLAPAVLLGGIWGRLGLGRLGLRKREWI